MKNFYRWLFGLGAGLFITGLVGLVVDPNKTVIVIGGVILGLIGVSFLLRPILERYLK